MKFFSRAWATGEIGDVDEPVAMRDYEDHVARLLPRLPATVRVLARGISLHDGLIRSVRFHRHEATLVLFLRCGDLQTGYFDLDLRYGTVDFSNSRLEDLDYLATSGKCELLYDELDVTADDGDTNYIHRMLFSPRGEIETVFRTLALAMVPQGSRDFPRDSRVYSD